MDAGDHRHADGDGGVDAEQVGDGLGGEGDPELVVEDEHRVDAALHQRAEGGLAALQVAGQPALPAPQRGLEAHQDGEAGGGQERTDDAGPGEQAGDDQGDDDHDAGHGEEPGAPAARRARDRSRWLPRDGRGGHTV